MHILDARTGEPVPAAPARRGLTRIQAHARRLDPTALRVLITADLLVRALELGGTPVWTILTSPRDHAELRTAATRLAIRPFEDAHDLASGLGESQAIHVAQRGAGNTLGEGPVVGVGDVEWPGAGAGAGAGAGPGAGAGAAVAGGRFAAGDARGTSDPAGPSPLPVLLSDPSALRLALLAVPRSEPVRLDPAALEDAAGNLARWRRAVAGWARQPSRPVPGEVRERLRAAWEDDLDLPAVLGVLRDVESAPGLADGARFETFAYADRLLALDLVRDIGGAG
ncbi:cysteinyl-tRNA synthetase [Streptomyces sp. NRRL B-3648]|nr:cysteinyl-tRNA synthetase [Streptomyces sp. NRRL B-3648]